MDFIFVIIMGGLWGSFANVCIYRLPLDKGVALGRSYCIKCKKQIVWYDNIPIISYLIISGPQQFSNCARTTTKQMFVL